MTFEELDQRFPNGFHDAEISRVAVDYENRTVTLTMDLRGNLPESENAHEYRRAFLTASDFYYFSIEAPHVDHLSYRRGSKITVAGYSEDETQFPAFRQVMPTLPVGAFCCRFYVHDWNSFIHIAAKTSQFLRVDDVSHDANV
jgi:hypothetical protein